MKECTCAYVNLCHELEGQKGDRMAKVELVQDREEGMISIRELGVDRRGEFCRAVGETQFSIMRKMGGPSIPGW